jgi:PKD repeat protein
VERQRTTILGHREREGAVGRQRAWRTALVAAVALIAGCASAGSARAYVIQGSAWPGHVITYHDAFAHDAPALNAAVRDWNHSGADVRFVAAPAGRAEVTIDELPPHFFPTITIPGIGTVSSDVLGYASLGRLSRDVLMPSPSRRYLYHGAHVWLLPIGARIREFGVPARMSEPEMARVAVHELGHVLGLGHNPHACAAMSPGLGLHCHGRHDWLGLCPDPLQPDDIRGAVALYGGHAPRGGTHLCPFAPPPGSVRALRAKPRSSSSDRVAVRWVNPPGLTLARRAFDAYSLGGKPTVESFEIHAAKQTCPKRGRDEVAAGVSGVHAGDATRTTVSLTPGTWCLAVQVLDLFGRPGAIARTHVTIAGPRLPVQRPVADFLAPISPVAGQPAAFEDESRAGSSPIRRWAWSFGDGSHSTAENPTHTYAQPGTYTVRLKVTDGSGRSGSSTQQVIVQAPEPPTAMFDGPDEATAGGDVLFGDESEAGSDPIASWSWSFGDGGTSTDESPDHVYEQPGTYTVTLTVTDADGMQSSSSQSITIDAGTEDDALAAPLDGPGPLVEPGLRLR